MPNLAKYAAARAAMPNPKKDTKAYNYMYATLQQVKEIIDPACNEHGIIYAQWQDNGVLITAVVDLETGEIILTDTRPLGGNTDQERGSSETYQRRYALLTVFGLTPEDDDGAVASRVKKPKKEDTSVNDAKARLWAALLNYAKNHGADAYKLLEGVRQREGYVETVEFLDHVTYEFETAD